MKIVDKGVLDASFMDFSTPSEFARSALYYCPQFGHFYCKQGYDIQKEYLELYLLMYICSGTMTIEVNGKSVTAGSNQIVLIDCYRSIDIIAMETRNFCGFILTATAVHRMSSI